MSTVTIRPLSLNDLAEVMRIQALCYHSIEPESQNAFINKLKQAPDCAFAVEGPKPDQLRAYLFALPIELNHPPSLDDDHYIVPKQPNALYLHDLAIDPAARGQHLSQPLLKAFFACANKRALPYASLIAIQQSSAFWQRYGFQIDDPLCQDPRLANKLASYGEAQYMLCNLGAHNRL